MRSVLIDDLDHCILCGAPREAMHHIFPGSRRKMADKYGYVVPLCNRCHTWGQHAVHNEPNGFEDRDLKRMAQRHFESHHGSREDFIRIFGKSYL